MRIIHYLILLVISAGAFNASADCTVQQAIIQTVSLGTINVQRDAPNNSEIGRFTTPGNAVVSAYSPTDRQYCEARANITYLSATPSSMPGVYNTNLSGVGIQVVNVPQWWSITSSAPGVIRYTWPNEYNVVLYKTGKIMPGKLAAGQIVYGWFGDNSQTFLDLSLDSETTINVLSCSLTTQSVNFNLGTLSAQEFGTQAGFIPDRSDTQNIGLNCDPGANINIELKGMQNPDATSDDSVLAISGQGRPYVADGVGVQFLYNGSALRLNNRMVLKQSPGGQETFPLVARYYQTKPVVKAGDASATATLEITYQ
ncbi:fimbrial protein [Atlantibacter sp.]|uniref:fimbrial protein n=1 Tax=Atlantibacter sp. TaxID=1903473 RepID=UPI0028AE7567|nr:fimbrial protein [Atlantibacter sp.]